MSLDSISLAVAIQLTTGVFTTETATPIGDKDDNFSTVEEVPYNALQERRLGHIGGHGGTASTVNASPSEMEEAVSNQGGDSIYNITLLSGDSSGTPGEHSSFS